MVYGSIQGSIGLRGYQALALIWTAVEVKEKL